MAPHHGNEALDPSDLIPPTEWIPSTSTSRCTTCTRPFNFFRRKYNCQTCGEVVCKNCTMSAPVSGQNIFVHVCMRCNLKRRQSMQNTPPPLEHGDIGTITEADSGNLVEYELAVVPRSSIPTNDMCAIQRAENHDMCSLEHPDDILSPRNCVPARSRFRCEHCRHVLLFRHRVNCQACGEVYCKRCVLTEIVENPGNSSRLHVSICLTCVIIRENLGSYSQCKEIKAALGATAYPPGVNVTVHLPDGVDSAEFARKIAKFKALEEMQLVPEEFMIRRDQAWSPSMKPAKCQRCDRSLTWRNGAICCMCGDAFCKTCMWRKFARMPYRSELDEVHTCSKCVSTFEHENRIRSAYTFEVCLSVYMKAYGVPAEAPSTPEQSALTLHEPQLQSPQSPQLGGLINTVDAMEPTTESDEQLLEVRGLCPSSRHFFARPTVRQSTAATTLFRLSNTMARQSISVNELLPKSKWAPAQDCYACMACTKSFTMFRTRQHCHVCGDVVCNACAVDTPVQNEPYQATVCLRCTTKRGSSRGQGKPKPVVRVDTIFDGTLFDPNDLVDMKKDSQAVDPVRQKKTQANLSKFELQVLPNVDLTADASATGSSRGVVPFDELVNLEDFASSLSRMRCYRCRRMMILHARHSCSACGEVFCRSCVTSEVTQPPGRRWLQNIDICLTCTTIKNNFGSYRECRWVHKSLTPTALPPGVQATIRCPLYVNRQEFSRKIAELKYIEEVQLIPWNQLPHRIKLFSMEGSKCGECDVKLTRSTRSRCSMCDSTFCVACTVQKFARLPTKFELEEVRVCVTCIAAFRRWNGTRCKELWKTCAEVYARASGTHVDSNIAPPPSSPIGWIRNRASLEFKSYDSDILNSNPRSSGPVELVEAPPQKPKGTKLTAEEEELLRTIERHLSVTEGIAKAIEGIDSRRSLPGTRRNSLQAE